MKKICKRISAAALALAVLLTSLVFDVPGKIFAKAATVSDFAAFKSAIASGGTITITSDITLTEKISVTNNVTIQSQGAHTIIRGSSFKDIMFFVSGSGNLTLNGSSGTLTIDGGTTWSGTTNATLGRGTSSSKQVDGSIIRMEGNAVVTLNTGVILQNNYSSTVGSAVTVNDKSTLNINGAVIRNNKTTGGGVLKTHMNGTINMTDGEIYGNEATTHGGAIQIYGCLLSCICQNIFFLCLKRRFCICTYVVCRSTVSRRLLFALIIFLLYGCQYLLSFRYMIMSVKNPAKHRYCQNDSRDYIGTAFFPLCPMQLLLLLCQFFLLYLYSYI
ncbi:MAG: translocation/assembly module TamB, partial [Oscillospiraceae bacterium]|nr:translocation/assembly module TamB [Oscillospiraceae bacterium]